MTVSAAVRPPPGDGRAVITGLFAAVALLSFGAVVAALVSQHAYAMEPCPWCVLQRLIFLAIGVVALLGLAWRGAAGSRFVAGLGLLLALAGIAAALWQHFVAARSASCTSRSPTRSSTRPSSTASCPTCSKRAPAAPTQRSA